MPLALPPEDVAVQRFIFDFVLKPGSRLSLSGHLEHLPDLHQACKPGSSLQTAVEAVAFANLSRRGHAPHYRELAARRYGETIRLTTAALSDKAAAFQDETVFACHLLSMYEVSLIMTSMMS